MFFKQRTKFFFHLDAKEAKGQALVFGSWGTVVHADNRRKDSLAPLAQTSSVV